MLVDNFINMINTTNEKFTTVVSGVQLTKQYSFLNKENIILPSEEWKEIPNTNGYYEVSNLGRIKSIDREIIRTDGRIINYKSKILTQSILKMPNKTVGDYVYELICTLRFDKVIKTVSINRLIYYVFVEPINFDTDRLAILHKNNDKLDNRVENLYTGTLSEKAQQIYDRKRGHKLSSFITKEAKNIGILNRCKYVSQYMMTGQKIALFKSIKAASIKTKISASSIIAACKLKTMVSAGGYLWQYGNGDLVIDVSYYNKFIEKSKSKTTKAITQFTIEGKIVKSYDSITQAAKNSGIKASNISNCINGHTTTAGGYLWKNGNHKRNIDVTRIRKDIEKSLGNKKKPLLQICPITHKVLNVYSCSNEAALKITTASARTIRIAATFKKEAGNYLWRFK
jgi:NUMOD4 motif/NUMOD1 domain